MDRDTLNSINRELKYLGEISAVLADCEAGRPVMLGYGGVLYNPTKSGRDIVLDPAYRDEYADFTSAIRTMVERSKARLTKLGYTGAEVTGVPKVKATLRRAS